MNKKQMTVDEILKDIICDTSCYAGVGVTKEEIDKKYQQAKSHLKQLLLERIKLNMFERIDTPKIKYITEDRITQVIESAFED